MVVGWACASRPRNEGLRVVWSWYFVSGKMERTSPCCWRSWASDSVSWAAKPWKADLYV